MRKIILLFLFSTFSLFPQDYTPNNPMGDIWLHMLTSGAPVASYYLGDQLNSSGNWFINFEVGQASWSNTDAGIGVSNSDPSGWTWRVATWYEDGTGSNKKVRADFGDFRFTSTGNWYFNGRAKGDGTDPWHYANTTSWTNTTVFSPSYYFTVNALIDPSGITAERDGTNTDDQINLTWTVWNSKNVMIVRSTGDYSTAPTQGTVYNVNDACGGGTVIYKGSGTSTASTGLSANTTYFYKLYSVNNDYYSPGATASAGTLPVELTSFAAKQTGNNVTLNWKTATETNNYGFEVQKSSDNSTWNKIGFVQGAGNSNSPKEYSYTDKLSNLNGKFYYRLKQMDNDGTISYSKVVEVLNSKPSTLNLSQNYPNPFNPSTVIKYQIPVDSRVSVKVYNVLGNVVATLQNGFQTAGEYSVTVDGSNLASGVYFYKIEAGDFSATKKMLLTK